MSVLQKILSALVATAMLVFPSEASAVDFTITGAQFVPGPGYGIDANEASGTLLDVRFSTSSFSPQNFSLTLGQSRTFTFGTVDLEEPNTFTGILPAETDGLGITAQLTFTAPTGGTQTLTATGEAFVGSITDLTVDYLIDWGSPVTIAFGNGDSSYRLSFNNLAWTNIFTQTQSVTITLLSVQFSIISVARSSNDILVNYNATTGKSYRLERKAAITDATWGTIAGVVDQTPSVNGPAVFTDPGAASPGTAFYRVRIL